MKTAPVLLVGTGNAHKLEEIQALLRGLGVRVVGADVLPAGEDIEENGDTFAANATIKATEYARRAAELSDDRPRWVIADDSGLAVDALDGAPGVRSARYAGEDVSYDDNNEKLVREMNDVPDGSRGARFVCAIACARVPEDSGSPAEVLFCVEGSCQGTIARSRRGAHGFGYDPLFIEDSTGKTFAEMPSELKNRLSHRGDALAQFVARFAERLAREEA